MRSIDGVTAVGVTPFESTQVIVREVDERTGRRSLLEQIGKLEKELSALFCATYPRTGFMWNVRSHGGPRLLGMAELERIRDDLADRLHENRALLGDRLRGERTGAPFGAARGHHVAENHSLDRQRENHDRHHDFRQGEA